MHIVVDDEDVSSLLWKVVKDIVDTLKGDKRISAAGTDAPDYYKDRDVNWYNRRNGGVTEPTETTAPTETTQRLLYIARASGGQHTE